MNGENYTPENRRYSEHPVTLWHPNGGSLTGSEFYWFPIDEPPVIEVASVDRRWARTVWESRGWVVSE
jgi:hypothetical protein